MRSYTDYVMETNDKGKQVPKKVGLPSSSARAWDYEFTVVLDIAQTDSSVVRSGDRNEL